jgi:hypothetical protein
MDETSLSAAKHFKVLKVKLPNVSALLPLTIEQGKLPHLTGCLTVSAAGKLFKPMIILPNLKHLKSLTKFTGDVSFASSVSGWMNSELFLIWARDIVAQISWYRQMELPADLRHHWIVIALDGHISRFNFEAQLLLNWAHIAVLLLPPHSTHVVQPVDVGLTSVVKTAYKQKLTSLLKGEKHDVLDLDGHIIQESVEQVCLDGIRVTMVDSFIHASSAGCTPTNIRAAFAKSGLCPYDPERALKSHFIAHSNAEQLLFGRIPKETKNIHPFVEANHRMISSDAGLKAFAEHILQHAPSEEDLTLSPELMQSIMERGSVTKGNHNVSLTGMPSMIVSLNGSGDGGLRIIGDHN